MCPEKLTINREEGAAACGGEHCFEIAGDGKTLELQFIAHSTSQLPAAGKIFELK